MPHFISNKYLFSSTSSSNQNTNLAVHFDYTNTHGWMDAHFFNLLGPASTYVDITIWVV